MTSGETRSVGPGTLLAGRYRLEDQLGEHDGALFWRATDTVLARSVAVHAMAADDERAPLLMEAARVSATVNDSHLLRVLDADDADGVCWVVQEWGEGLSLDLMLERGPLEPARAAWLAHEVATAIAAGHAQGVAHGRLNPESVLVTSSGAVKLIGYVVDASLHPAPVSPLHGELEAHEADVLDLGGVLYAALTGRWPGVSPSALPAAPDEGGHPLRPRQVRAGVPRALDHVCERVLHGDRARHGAPIRTAHEFAVALAEVTGGTPAALDPAAMHDEPTTVLSRAALAEEAQRRAAERRETTRPTPVLDDAGQADDTTATAAVPTQDPPGPTGEPEADPEATALHQEPVEPRFEDSPDRPLYATTERRRPAGSTTPAATGPQERVPTGGRTPPPPPAAGWPFETDPEPAPAGRDHSGRGWLRTAVVVGLVLVTVLAVLVAFNLGRGSGMPGLGQDPEADTTSEAPTEPVAIEPVEVSDFDPQGDAPYDENTDEVPNATDGDPSTAWTTATYFNRSDLGGLKDGVGLLLDLGEEQQVGSLDVRFANSPTDVEVYAAAEGVTSAPTSTDQMELVAEQAGAGERAELALEPAPTTRYVLLWLTDLPATDGGFRGEVAELALTS